MTTLEDLFPPPEDTLIDKLYKQMKQAIDAENFELAQELKGNIIHTMGQLDWEGWDALNGNLQRIMGRIAGGEIRLHPQAIGYEPFLLLTTSVFEEKQSRTMRTREFRNLVADNVVRLGIELPSGGRRAPRRLKPNRAFLDILATKTSNPQLMNELMRREQSKLWHAMERGDIKAKSETIEKMKELKRKRDYGD